MKTIFDNIYTVERGLSYLGAHERMLWLVATNKQKYFDDLLISQIQIVDENNAVVIEMEV